MYLIYVSWDITAKKGKNHQQKQYSIVKYHYESKKEVEEHNVQLRQTVILWTFPKPHETLFNMFNITDYRLI